MNWSDTSSREENKLNRQSEFNGVPRHAALVMLIADSEAGQIRYKAAVTFFPHKTDDDFTVFYNANFSKFQK